MKHEGLSYFKDVWNWVDVIGFLSFGTLIFLEFVYYMKNSDVELEILRTLKVIILISMVIKFNYFLRIYENFGLLVNLVSTCLKDMTPFTVYLASWILAFTMLYK